MTEYQAIVMVVPSITKLLTSEDFRIGAIGSAEIISVRTNLMGSMRTYTKAQLDNHACFIEASDTISSDVSIAAPFQITYGSNQTAEGTLLKMNIPMFTNLEPDAANELAASSMYPMEVRQNLTVTEIPTGGTLLYNDSPVSVGDTVRLDSNLTFEPDDYMNESTEFDRNGNPIPRRLGVSVTYHGSTYDVAGQTFTVPVYPQTYRSSVIRFSKFNYDNTYYGLNVNTLMPYSGMTITIDALPSNAGTLYYNYGGRRYPVVVGDIAFGSILDWKSSLPPTADYSQNLEYHYEDRIVNGVLTYPAGVGKQLFQVTVLGPSMYTHTFSFPECQSDGSPWPHGTEVGALDYAAAQPVTASIVTSGSPFTVSGDVLIVDNGSQLNYETKPTWIIKARVTDQYGQYREANQTINISDVGEAPVIKHLVNIYTVYENSPAGTNIGSFKVTAESYSHNITTTISGSLGDSILGKLGYNLSDIFYCTNGQYPEICVKNETLLDYERLVHDGSCTFTATVTVHDNTNGTSASATTRIEVLNKVEPSLGTCLISVNGKLLQPTNYTGFILKVNR